MIKLFCFLLITVCSISGKAQQLFVEDFTYSGSLTAHSWIAHSGVGSNPISTSVTAGLTYAGFPGSGIGNAALINNVSGEDDNISFANQNTNGQNIYYSCMINISDVATTKGGDYFMHIGSPGGASFSNFSARVFAKIVTGNVNFGISNTSTATYGTTNFLRNTTYLLVVKYTINTAGNDPVSLWIIPTGIPLTEAAAGTAEITNTGTAGQDAINTIALRQGSTSSTQTVVDGLRVGTTWASVTQNPPSIAITGTLHAVGPTVYGTASDTSDFSVSGSDLTNDITITAPAGYEVSVTGNPNDYGPSRTLSPSSGSVSTTPIHARLAASTTVGSYTGNIIISSTGATSVNVATVSSSVTPLSITATGATAVDKVYNRTNAATITGAIPSATVNADVITITGGGTFDDFLVGNSKTVTPALGISGTHSSSYTFIQPANLLANITAASLTITSAQAQNKIFDGTDAAVITGTLNGIISPDEVILNGTGTFASSAVGNGIAVTSTSTLSGANAGNYTLIQPTGLSANITPAGLTAQTISFTLSPTAIYGDAPITLNGTASSGLTVTYVNSNPLIASISGNVLTLLKPGTVTITASQAGDGTTYDNAPDVTQTITISSKTITVTGAVAQNKIYNGNTLATVTGETLVGVVSPDDVTVSGGGIFADPNVNTGIPVTTNLVLGNPDAFKYTLTQPTGLTADITQASQTITFNALTPKAYGDANFNLTATATSGLTVTYTSSAPSVATVSGNIVTIVGVGSTTITATQVGNANYAAAPDVPQELVVGKAAQVITFDPLPNKLSTDADFLLTTATSGISSSGLNVSFSSSNTAVATVSGATLHIVGAGTTNITATQTGNGNYLAATPVVQPLTVVPVLAFAPVPMATQPGKSYTENFNDIATWGNGFSAGQGANRWASVAAAAGTPPNATVTTQATTTFATGSGGGVQKGSAQIPVTTSILLLSTGGTDNTSSAAIDFFMDFTGEIANKLSFDATTVFNSSGDRGGALKVYASVDGTSWTELTGSGLPFLATNNIAGSVVVSNLQLPAIFNNSATARLRFYYYNISNGNNTGSRPKISIDNLTVSALLPPVINSSLVASASVGNPFSYSITASNTNASSTYNATGLPAGLGINTTTGIITGTPTSVGAGTYNSTITATNAAGSDTKTLVITVNPGNQVITFNALAARTYGDAPFTLNGTSNSGLAVSYSSSNTAIATVTGNTVAILAAGSVTISADQAGDANWNPAATVQQTLLINKANQTITFAALPNKLDTDGPYTLGATASSGLPVSYSSSVPGVATVSGNTVTIVAAGTTVITASQAGDANYNAAPDVSQNQVVSNTNLSPQVITFNALANKTYGDAPFALTATASSGLTVTYSSSDNSIATITGNTVTLVGVGIVNITASQAGDGTYNPAPDVTQPLTVDPKALTVAGAVANDKVYNGNTVAIITGATLSGVVGSDDVSVTGGGTFTDPNVANAIPVTANLTLTGTTAPRYILVQPVGLTANISKADQTISFSALPSKTTAAAPFTLAATATSGLPVSYSSSNTAVATVSGSTLTLVGVGTTVITASQAGNINYNAATSVTQNQAVTIGAQTITFGPLPGKLITDPAFSLNGTASSGLVVSYASSNPIVATVSGNTVTILGGGTTTITATQAGNANFTAATPVPQVLTVTQPFAPVVMAAQPLRKYTEDFNDIANWANGFIGGNGAKSWQPVGTNPGPPVIPSANTITVSTASFVTGTTQGVQKGTAQAVPVKTSIVLLAINATENITSSAIDFFMDFTGVIADTLHFSATSVFNSTGNRVATLHVYASTDGTTWTELTGTGLPYVATNNITDSTVINNIHLPASFNNSATARLRFYVNNGTGGSTGSRPKISIDDLIVTAVQAPVINSSLTSTGTVNVPYSYSITATNNPTSFAAPSGLPAWLTISGNTISGTPTAAGTYNITIEATNAGGTDSKTLVLTVGKASQLITGLAATDTRTYGDASYNLAATASSGLPVSYVSSNTSVATIAGNTVTIIGAGTTTITASQAGDANYNAAPDVTQLLTVNKANQTITFAALPNKQDSDVPYTLGATASSGLPVSYSSSNTAVATISGNTVTIVGPGTTVITASQAGDLNYNASPDQSQNQVVINTNLTPQTITFNALSNKTYGDAPFALTATASSGLTVTYVSTNTAVATIAGNVVTIVGAGTTNIIASQAGDGTYNFAADVTQPFTVDPKSLTVTGAVAQNKVYDGNAIAIITGGSLTGIVGSDNVSFSGGGTFTSINVGTAIPVGANLVLGGSSSTNYTLVQPTGLAADITIAGQMITFNPLTPKSVGDAAFALTANSSSGLTVSYSSSNTAVATVSGNTVTIISDGSTIITATQAGNGNYSAATPVAQTLLVNPPVSVVTWNFGTSAGNASPSGTIPAGLAISDITRFNNNGTTTLLTSNNASNIYAGASGQFNAGAAVPTGPLDAATSTYFEFTLTPVAYKRVTLTAINFGARSTAVGPIAYSVRSSLNNYASDIKTGSIPASGTWGLAADATTASTSNYGGAVTYRIYGYGGTGGATAANWRIDDVSLSLQLESAPPCTGAPLAGNVSAGTGTFCLTGSTTLTLTGYTDPATVTGIGLQWFSSTDNVNFTPVASETNPTLATGTITQTTYYYCQVSCSASGLSANSDTITVTVNQAANAGTVTGPSDLCINATALYTSTGDTGGVWSSLNTTVATIDPSGLVTVVGAGSTDITYTVTGCTGPVSNFVTLSVAPNLSAGTITGSAALCAGSTETYNGDGDLGGTWSSSDPSVASIDGSGTVTALTAGTTTLSYSINSGCGSPVSAVFPLTVNAIPPAPGVTVVNNNNATSTLTATGYTGTLLWSTNQTINPITVSAAGTYFVTQTVNGCTSAQGSGVAAPTIIADPAVTGLDITDMSDVSIPDANAVPYSQVVKLKVPVFNLNQENAVPAGATTLKIDLGTKFSIDPAFTLSTASLNNYFNWTATNVNGHVIISGDQYAAIPEDFDGIASFQVIADTSCSSVITASLIVDNHGSIIMQDEDVFNNIASLNYAVIVPAPLASVTQPTCAVATGTITITSPAPAGITYSIDGTSYVSTNTFTVPAGSYNVTAKTADGCISAVSVIVVNPQPTTATTITFTTTQPTCLVATGSITITSPTGLTYSIDGVDYSNTTGQFTNLTPGDYNLTAREVGGCPSMITVATINPQPATPGTIVFTTTQPDCATATGSITITSPNDAGMSYSIDGSDYTNTTGTFTDLVPGSYSLTVKTAGGCTSAATPATINPQPLSPTLTLGNIFSTGCSGSPVGSITVIASGAPGVTFTIAGPTVNTTGQTSGTFTALSAGNYVITAQSTSGCSSTISATVVGPTGTVPDISLGSNFSSNLFPAVGSTRTVVFNISEIAGNPATGDTLRITKIPGYTITFNPALTANPLSPANPLDNTRWKADNTSSAFLSLIFDPNHNSTPGTLNCGERVFISVSIQRNTPNVAIFSLSARLRQANSETYTLNNLNSILFFSE